VDGFVSPEDFVAQLGLGLGRYRFDRREYVAAIRHFEEVAGRHEGTPAAAQALFWLGFARFKQSTEPQQGEERFREDSVFG
jgi:outer membrane protein assembly factor BamD (BamD/ComL family)